MNIFNKNIPLKTPALFGLISTLALPIVASAGLEISNPDRQYEVTVVKGRALPIVGESTAEYSLMAVEAGTFLPIPFQFDDKNIKGLNFVPGAVVKIDGSENVVDAQDELAFMYRDMGSKADPVAIGDLKGAIVSELEITEDGTSRYAYLVKGNAMRSDKVCPLQL